MLALLAFAGSQRLTGGTLKNRDSSRSHAFYRLTITPQGVRPVRIRLLRTKLCIRSAETAL